MTSEDHQAARPLPSSLMRCGIVVLVSLGTVATAQNLPEPPLPLPPARDARAAAAQVQAPQNLRPPPPIPSPIPAPTAGDEAKPSAGSPIPPQSPEAAVPPTRSPATAQAQQLPTGFQSKVTTSTSTSGQFKVYGKDLQTRSPFSSRCDEVAARLKRLLHDEEPWVLPVVVSVRTGSEAKPTGPTVSTSISQITNGGFHLQVTVNVRPDLRPADFDVELTRILVAERILRNHTEITTKRSMVLPEWLLTGVSQAMTFRDRSRPSAVFTAIFRSGKIYSIEEILDAAPGQLDALSRTIYETSCCALVLALLDQPDGAVGMRKFLSLLAIDSRDDRALLNACFPRLALSASSLNKWWSLQLASLATPSIFETLGPTQTKKALAEALVIHYETTIDTAPKKTTVIADADTPPEPAPEEENKRGFIGRIFGSSSNTEKKPDEKIESAKPKSRTADEAKAEEEATHEEKKRGILGRMFGARGPSEVPAEETKEEKKSSEDSQPKPEPKKVAKEAEKQKEEAKPAPEDNSEPKKPGFLGRMFGGGKTPDEAAKDANAGKTDEDPKKAAKPKSEPKPAANDEPKEKPAKKTEPAKPAAEEEKTEEPKKRGFLGRMFRGGSESKSGEAPAKKSDAKKPEGESEPAEKKKSASVESSGSEMEIRQQIIVAAERLVTEASAWWATFTEMSGGHEVKLRLPFTKKKDAPEEPKAEEQTKPVEKPAVKRTESEPEKKEAESKRKSEPPARSKAKAAASKPRMVPVSIPVEDYANIMKRKDRAQILEGSINSLHGLQSRANVLFRPIIADYIAVIGDLQNGKTKDADKRLAELRSRTTKAYEQAKAVESQLDAYEANETKNYSGAFEDYLHLPAQIEKELPVRDDPLSKYLDALEKEFVR